MTPAKLVESRLWCYESEWLVHLRSHTYVDFEMPDECLREIKIGHHQINDESSLNNIMHSKEYSSLSRLLRLTAYAYVTRFIDKLNPRVERSGESEHKSHLTAYEIGRAEVCWIRETQKSLLEEPTFDTWKQHLGLFLYRGWSVEMQGQATQC